jgi:hypothetical protein
MKVEARPIAQRNGRNLSVPVRQAPCRRSPNISKSHGISIRALRGKSVLRHVYPREFVSIRGLFLFVAVKNGPRMDPDSHRFKSTSKITHAEIESCGVYTVATVCSTFYIVHPLSAPCRRRERSLKI